jgi:hypothetical protein
MKTIAGRGRKILSRLFRVISVSAASLILQACYGIMPPDEPYVEYGMPPPAYGMPDPPQEVQETTIRGTVVSAKTGDPIFGIKVSIDGTEHLTRTNLEGYFYLNVPTQEVYSIKFEDTDGPYNDGLFKTKILPLRQNNSYYNLLIDMELDTQTNAEPGTETDTETDEE